MIYDCFTFLNELDVLEIRLEELYPVVDEFIVVEGNKTFQGGPKDLMWQQAMDRFERYSDKIHWHAVTHWPDTNDPWGMERHQRECIKFFLEKRGPSDSDVVLLSDVDEIPRRATVMALNSGLEDFASLQMDMYYYSLNLESGQHWIKPKAFRWGFGRGLSFEDIRFIEGNEIADAGWHFSYFGDADMIVEKFRSFAHSELNRVDTTDPNVILSRMSRRENLWGDGRVHRPAAIDSTWPEAVTSDRERWRKYEWPVE